MGDHRHATDRVDGMLVAECPNKETEDDSHLSVVVDYHDAADNDIAETFVDAWPECHECGAEMDYVSQERPTEVLD